MDEIINKRIREYREKAKMTQEEAGAILGLKRNAYSAKEGKGKFTVGEVKALAKEMDIDPDLIFYGEKKLDFSPVEPTIITVNDPFKENPFLSEGPKITITYETGNFTITNEEKNIVTIFRNLDEEKKNKVRDLLLQLK
ncbi:MAG: helix-turn-helix transcriptional regulator [Clostridia bacterium]|nr:helix-turn-helix transcriptional regulator [Clostridia bacterium]